MGVLAGEPSPSPQVARGDKAFFGHPKALSTLFFTEMWERFSYYGMRAILALYLVSELSYSDASAASFVAIYGSAIYMAGVAGGWLADRVISAERATFWGGVLIMFAHIALATPFGETALFTGVILLVAGTGLLKPNISNIVGDMYSKEDTRRDAGFTIFYFAVNFGAFTGQMITGYLGEKVNWHWGFGAAAIGMALGLIQYVIGRKGLPEAAKRPPKPLTDAERPAVKRNLITIGVITVVVLVIMGMLGWLTKDGIGWLITTMSVILPIMYFRAMLTSKEVTPVERDRVKAYIPLFLSAAVFWMLFEQQASILALWAAKKVNLTVGGWTMPASWVQSINPMFVMLFALVFAGAWTMLGKRQPSTPVKFASALLIAGGAYVLLAVVAGSMGTEKVPLLWLVLMYMILTIAELLLSPIGVSATTKLAPEAFKSQMMAVWFLAVALGLGANAQIAKLYSEANEVPYFLGLAAASVVAGLLLVFGARNIRRKMHGVP